MPTHEVPGDSLVTLLEEAFAELIETSEVDIVADQAAAEYDVQADTWTLHLEGSPVSTGFLALDDEPLTETERSAALGDAFEAQHLAAMRNLNRALDGGLYTALIHSGDVLTLMLVEMLGDSSDDDQLDAVDE